MSQTRHYSYYYLNVRRSESPEATTKCRERAVSKGAAIRKACKRYGDAVDYVSVAEVVPIAEHQRKLALARRKAAKEQSLTKKRNKALSYWEKANGWADPDED